MAKALSGLPVFFDHQSYFRKTYALQPGETPVVFFLDHEGTPLYCYRAHYRIQERSEGLLRLVKALSERYAP